MGVSGELPHLPVIRRGRLYESLDQIPVNDHRTGQSLATISQVNAGVIRKDLAKITESRARLRDFSVAELFTICAKAGELFAKGKLPLGDQGHEQSPQQYIETLSATSGLPHN